MTNESPGGDALVLLPSNLPLYLCISLIYSLQPMMELDPNKIIIFSQYSAGFSHLGSWKTQENDNRFDWG